MKLLIRRGDGLDLLLGGLEALHHAGDERLAALFVFLVDVDRCLQLVNSLFELLVLPLQLVDVLLVEKRSLAAAVVARAPVLALRDEEAVLALACGAWRHGLGPTTASSLHPRLHLLDDSRIAWSMIAPRMRSRLPDHSSRILDSQEIGPH